MTTKDLIIKAVEKLNKVKHLGLMILNIEENMPEAGELTVSFSNENDNGSFNLIIDYSVTDRKRLPNEPTNISLDATVMLRIAKEIFEAYKKSKSSTADSGLVYSNVNSIELLPTAYDISISGRNIADAFDDVDLLRDEIRQLKADNDDLTRQISDLKNAVDMLLSEIKNDKGRKI